MIIKIIKMMIIIVMDMEITIIKIMQIVKKTSIKIIRICVYGQR